MRLALCIVAWLVTAASAQLTVQGQRTLEGGVSEGQCVAYDFDDTDFDVTNTNGVCGVALGASVVIDGAGMTGAPADFESTVDLSSKTLRVPNGTASANGTCASGEIYVDTDTTSVTATGASICRATNTQVPIGDLTSGGVAGDETWTAGSGTGDSAIINATSSAAPTTASRLKICNQNPTYSSTGNNGCLTLWPAGVTIGLGSNTDTLAGLELTSTVTETGSATSTLSMVRGKFIRDLVGSGLMIGGHTYLLDMDYTEQNSNTNATVIAGNARAVNFKYSCQKAGSGSNFSIAGDASATTGVLGTIGTGCTLPDFYAGGQALTGGTVNGTLTRWWGYRVGVPSVGSSKFQYGADEFSSPSTPPSNVVVWGAETGSPGRFFAINESGHKGYLNTGTWTTTCTALTTTTASAEQFCLGPSAPVATIASNATVGTVDEPSAGPVHVYAIAVSLSSAPATTSVRTFRLFVNGSAASPALSCTITGSATTCNGRLEAGAPVTAGQPIAVGEDITVANAAAATATITLWWNLDAF